MFRRATIVLIAIGFIAPAHPWGEDGHRITGAIATGLLSDAARAGVQSLLGGESLSDASTWADEIRRTSYWSATGKLHYVNVDRDSPDLKILRDSRTGDSILGALAYYRMVLESPSADAQSRKEALKFLVHFIGDIHQPLHVSYADDKGGNDVDVRFFGRAANLHSVWDTLLLKREHDDWSAAASLLRGEITHAEISAWAQQDPILWAKESHNLTRVTVYQFENAADLGQDYYHRNVPIVMLRLKQAGVRIAAVLNDVFERRAGTISPAGE